MRRLYRLGLNVRRWSSAITRTSATLLSWTGPTLWAGVARTDTTNGEIRSSRSVMENSRNGVLVSNSAGATDAIDRVQSDWRRFAV